MFNNAKDKNVKAFSTFASSSSITYNFRYGKKKVRPNENFNTRQLVYQYLYHPIKGILPKILNNI